MLERNGGIATLTRDDRTTAAHALRPRHIGQRPTTDVRAGVAHALRLSPVGHRPRGGADIGPLLCRCKSVRGSARRGHYGRYRLARRGGAEAGPDAPGLFSPAGSAGSEAII